VLNSSPFDLWTPFGQVRAGQKIAGTAEIFTSITKRFDGIGFRIRWKAGLPEVTDETATILILTGRQR
jgi:hypothetical protein